MPVASRATRRNTGGTVLQETSMTRLHAARHQPSPTQNSVLATLAISNEWSIADIARKVDCAIVWYGWNLNIRDLRSLEDGSVRVDLASSDRTRTRILFVDRHTGRISL